MKVDVLIFSKDRACQLDLLLSSIRELVSGLGTVTVIYHTTEEKFVRAYNVCKLEHPTVEFLTESDFRSETLSWLSLSSREESVMMLVDDIVFKEKVDFAAIAQIIAQNPQILFYSPRLGLHLTDCYSMNSSQPVPSGNTQGEYFLWSWMNAQLDWNYVFSVDGHVFRRSELLSWVSHLDFSNPNTFESAMQEIPKKFALTQTCISHIVSRLLNIPMNRVQNTYMNRCENISHVELNDHYLEGKRLDSKKYAGNMNRSCHVNLPAEWRQS
jgi:hypothetical protein